MENVLLLLLFLGNLYLILIEYFYVSVSGR